MSSRGSRTDKYRSTGTWPTPRTPSCTCFDTSRISGTTAQSGIRSGSIVHRLPPDAHPQRGRRPIRRPGTQGPARDGSAGCDALTGSSRFSRSVRTWMRCQQFFHLGGHLVRTTPFESRDIDEVLVVVLVAPTFFDIAAEPRSKQSTRRADLPLSQSITAEASAPRSHCSSRPPRRSLNDHRHRWR